MLPGKSLNVSILLTILELLSKKATLQELTDLQDTVNDLIQENRLLFDEKSLLYDSLCKQSSKLDNYRLQIENLKHLLLSSTEISFKRRFANFRDEDNQESNVDENQRLLEILKNTHEEYEDLLKKYDTLRSSYKIIDGEHKNDRESLFKLNEKLDLYEKRFETHDSEKYVSEKLLIGVQTNLERCQVDLNKARKECEKEKKRILEMQLRFAANNDTTEVQYSLDLLRRERDDFENEVSLIENLLKSSFNDLNLLKEKNFIFDNDMTSNCQKNSSSEEPTKIIGRENIHENDASKLELSELKAAFLELNRSFERQVDDKKELNDEIFTLQKALDDCENDLRRVRKDFLELNALREKETEDWKQFQADLQIAVVVANDFKVEAQDEIEKLTLENSQLNDQVSMLKCELDKLRNKSNSCEESMKNHSFASSSPSSFSGNKTSPELKAKLTGYLSSIETTTNASTPFMGKSKYLMPHIILLLSLSNATILNP
uniref:Uncharacterized protein n=1 Tax=Romanomermis culicivorax TaxID=13658 RepID=A0A915L6P1_ROMCU